MLDEELLVGKSSDVEGCLVGSGGNGGISSSSRGGGHFIQNSADDFGGPTSRR